jgi:hypothetical protein
MKRSRVLEALGQGLVNRANPCALATIFSNIAGGLSVLILGWGAGVTTLLYVIGLLAIHESEEDHDNA